MCNKIVRCIFCHDNFTQICFHGTQRDLLYVLNGKCVPRLITTVSQNIGDKLPIFKGEEENDIHQFLAKFKESQIFGIGIRSNEQKLPRSHLKDLQ